MKCVYTIEYRLDDYEDYDSTEYEDGYTSKAKANKRANEIKKQYKDRLVLLDIIAYCDDEYDSEYECQVDAWQII